MKDATEVLEDIHLLLTKWNIDIGPHDTLDGPQVEAPSKSPNWKFFETTVTGFFYDLNVSIKIA